MLYAGTNMKKWLIVILLYTTLIRNIITVKENYFSKLDSKQAVYHCFKAALKNLTKLYIPVEIFVADKDLVVEDIFKFMYSARRISIISKNFLHRSPKSHHVIFGSNPNMLREMFRKDSYNIYSRYIIITNMNDEELNNFFTYLWYNGYVYIVFIIIRDPQEASVRYFRTSLKNKTNDLPKLRMITRCYSNLSRISDLEIRPFSTVICPAHGCYLRELRVSDDITFPGYLYNNGSYNSTGTNIINIFVQMYNIRKTSAVLISNYTWDHVEWLFDQDKVDVIHGSSAPTVDQIDELDFTSIYRYVSYYFMDKTEPMSNNYSLFRSFKWSIWVTYCASIFFYCASMLLIKKLYRKGCIKEKINLFDVFAIILQQGIRRHPMNTGLRVLLSVWILYNFIINNAFTSAFRSALLSKRSDNFLTLSELSEDESVSFGGLKTFRNFFNDSNDPIIYNIYKRYQVLHAVEVFDALIEKDMLVIASDFAYDVITDATAFNKSFNKIYKMNEAVNRIYIQFYLRKGHPYLERLNDLVLLTQQHGILRIKNIPDMNTVESYNDYEIEYINLAHLTSTLQIISIGIFISILCFFIEIFIYSAYCY